MALEMCAEEIKFRLKTQAGFSLRSFAQSIGRHPSTVSMVIHGRRQSQPIMNKIEQALKKADLQSDTTCEEKEGIK